jgi:NADH dehydrogenase FAD-containing subunit
MLYEIAACDLDLTNVVNPVRKMIRHVNFSCGDVDKIDIDKNRSLSRMVSIITGTPSSTITSCSRPGR